MTWKNLTAGALFIAVFGFLVAASTGAFAADKAADVGGNCCTDLEERIAELEATTAKKGNRKVKIIITGQISESLVRIDSSDAVLTLTGPGGSSSAVVAKGVTHTQVQSNSNRDAQTYVNIVGEAAVSPGVKAGFVLSIGLGGFDQWAIGPFSNGSDTNGVYTRESYVYLKSDTLGGVSVGKAEMATYDITGSTGGANTGVAHTKLSLAPLIGPPNGTALDIFDGGIADIVKYKSPVWQGVWLEASWGNADQFSYASGLNANGDMWDVALKYNAEPVKNFTVDGRVGYRDGHVVGSSFNIQDIKVWAGSLGVMQKTTGLFVNGSYGNLDYSHFCPTLGGGMSLSCDNATGWEVQAGDEYHWFKAGKTSIFANYGETKVGLGLSGVGGSAALDMKLVSYGGGVVQSLDSAAMDVFASWTHYQADLDASMTGLGSLNLSQDTDVIMTGAKIRF